MGNYYRIKCVNCMAEVANEDFVYDISKDFDRLVPNAEDSRTAYAPQSSAGGGADFGSDDGGFGSASDNFGDPDDDFDASRSGAAAASASTAGIGDIPPEPMKADAIMEYFARRGSRAVIQEIPAAEDIRTAEVFADETAYSPNDLIVGAEVRNLEYQSNLYSGTLPRHCPYCHERISAFAGKMPTFIVTMFGISNAGKTVYLTTQCALHNRLRYSFYGGYARAEVDTSHLPPEGQDGKSNDVIDACADDLIREHLLPNTTTAMHKAHCLRISTYRTEDTTQQRPITECLVAFRDIMGELLSFGKVDESKRRTVFELFESSDGIILLTDPRKLLLPPELAFIGSAQDEEDKKPTTEKTTEEMHREIKRMMEDPRTNQTSITTPTVAMLAKLDVLDDAADYFEAKYPDEMFSEVFGQSEYYPYSEKVFQSGEMANWKEVFLDKLSAQTQSVLRGLDGRGNWYAFLNGSLANRIFVPVSSIGSGVTVKSRRLYRKGTEPPEEATASDLEPRYLELPLLWLLMQFGAVPPMHLDEFYDVSDFMEVNAEAPPKKQNPLFAFFRKKGSPSGTIDTMKPHFNEWLELAGFTTGGTS